MEGEKHQCLVASHTPPTGDLAHNPGMCPDWESNWRPFGLQNNANPLRHQSGQCLETFFIFINEGVLLDRVEARDTAKHPTMQKTVPTTNNYPVQRESSSQVCENISSIGTPTEATFIPQIFQ